MGTEKGKRGRNLSLLFAAHLYASVKKSTQKWASVLVGALLYVKGRSLPTLVGELAKHLRLPAGVRHVWLGDRGILTRPMVRTTRSVPGVACSKITCAGLFLSPPFPAPSPKP